MKFPTCSILSLALATRVIAAPTIQAATAHQPPSPYPIGRHGGANAKVAGRLFDIDGRVEYFAGENIRLLVATELADVLQDRMLGGLHI